MTMLLSVTSVRRSELLTGTFQGAVWLWIASCQIERKNAWKSVTFGKCALEMTLTTNQIEEAGMGARNAFKGRNWRTAEDTNMLGIYREGAALR